MSRAVTPPTCADCGALARLTTKVALYPHRPDLSDKLVWVCACGARVGCHGEGSVPLGSPAGKETREARVAAHAAFDPLWKAKMARDRCSKKAARGAAYRWLAAQLGIPREDCHIAMMSAETAKRVVTVCATRSRRTPRPVKNNSPQ